MSHCVGGLAGYHDDIPTQPGGLLHYQHCHHRTTPVDALLLCPDTEHCIYQLCLSDNSSFIQSI